MLAAHTALRIEAVKIKLGTLVKLNAQLRGRPTKGSRLAQDDFSLGLRSNRRETCQQGGTGTDGEFSARERHGGLPKFVNN